MKKIIFQGILLALLGFLIFLSFSTLMPLVNPSQEKPKEDFSVARAMKHVEHVADKPHFVGSADHSKVRNYIVDQFQKLGLETHTQNAYTLNANAVLTNPTNIISVLEGSSPRKKGDLLVLAHYDSDPHSALGAADDGAGVAAILESIRALLADGFVPENNIIFAITDAEEIGLLGAQLFAEQHPLVDNVGLVLNFEARGTKGPSNAIVETNHGNAGLIKAFSRANPRFPMASSLMYEVYKNMPNDTDATVFREMKDLPTIFFAFIDGHYNYHTANDSPENLDTNSLAHQGSYLMDLLPALGKEDLTQLKSSTNQVYFNFPIFKLVQYSYHWIYPILAVAWVSFFILLGFGLRRRSISLESIGKGIIAFLGSMLSVAIITFLGWKLIMQFYPQYGEIQQGFPYNGQLYIATFIFLSFGVCLWIYHRFWKINNKSGLLVFPLLLWLLINTFLAIKLKGASFFIWPVFFLEIAWGLLIWNVRFKKFGFMICSIPAVFIFSPLIVFIPVALGLNLLYGAMLLFALQLIFILPIFDGFKRKDWLGIGAILVAVFFFYQAHLDAGFSKSRPKPNSLVYYQDLPSKHAHWLTYDTLLDNWTRPFFTGQKQARQKDFLSSKYGTGYVYEQDADWTVIPAAAIEVEKDSSMANLDRYRINITNQRTLHRINLFSEQLDLFKELTVNLKEVDLTAPRYSKIKKTGKEEQKRVLTYYPTNQDTLKLVVSLPKNTPAEIQLFGVSHDLLDNPWVEVPSRQNNMMPKPFVVNDAIITRQVFELQ